MARVEATVVGLVWGARKYGLHLGVIQHMGASEVSGESTGDEGDSGGRQASSCSPTGVVCGQRVTTVGSNYFLGGGAILSEEGWGGGEGSSAKEERKGEVGGAGERRRERGRGVGVAEASRGRGKAEAA